MDGCICIRSPGSDNSRIVGNAEVIQEPSTPRSGAINGDVGSIIGRGPNKEIQRLPCRSQMNLPHSHTCLKSVLSRYSC